jgi:hypothetical protein
MHAFALRPVLGALFFLLVSAPALAKQQELPEITEDGLHRVPDSRMASACENPARNFCS